MRLWQAAPLLRHSISQSVLGSGTLSVLLAAAPVVLRTIITWQAAVQV